MSTLAAALAILEFAVPAVQRVVGIIQQGISGQELSQADQDFLDQQQDFWENDFDSNLLGDMPKPQLRHLAKPREGAPAGNEISTTNLPELLGVLAAFRTSIDGLANQVGQQMGMRSMPGINPQAPRTPMGQTNPQYSSAGPTAGMGDKPEFQPRTRQTADGRVETFVPHHDEQRRPDAPPVQGVDDPVGAADAEDDTAGDMPRKKPQGKPNR